MASFNGKGRNEGPKRRPGDPRRNRAERLNVESLEQRRMLDGSNPVWHATTTDVTDIKNGPLANLGSDLVKLYSEYYQYSVNGSQGTFQSVQGKSLVIAGNTVALDVRGNGDFGTFRDAVTSLGMVVTATESRTKTLEGFFPIAQLPQLASQAQTVGATAIPRPVAKQQGIANNQGDGVLLADAARTNFGLTGAGVKIGVLSDSYSLVGGPGVGAAASMASGDLPPNVQVIQEGPRGADEGRAMLEQIYDIAPGASLAYATAIGTGPVGFGNNIRALAAAGSTVIVDDIGYDTEPFFQDGDIVSGINDVTAQGVTYLTAAGNAADSGYLSQFRPVTATVGAIGAGTFQNFDGSGATTQTLLPIIVTRPLTAATSLTFQYSQPFNLVSGVTSDLDIFLLDANGAIVFSGTTNNLASQLPMENLRDLAPGNYNIAIQLKSGPAPTYVEVASLPGGVTVSHAFGSAGQTYYPSAFGHASTPNAISVGAVPWFNAPPYFTGQPLYNEPFSSNGPSIRLFNFDGSSATQTLQLKPDVSAPDGVNTTFFGDDIDTTQPPFTTFPTFPGQPTILHPTRPTPTNLDPDTLPNFFGTSSAAPNLAAVVALMKQRNPSLTPQQIAAALRATATPINGAAPGVWDVQGGFGLANAVAAINAISQASVASFTPGAGQTITQAPGFITVTFSRPIQFSSVQASDLQITAPNGATVVVGTPVAVNDPNFPTVVRFPIAITPAPNQVANGIYTVAIATGAILAADGASVQGASQTFNLQQTVAPTVINTTFADRIVTVRFSGPLNPATVNPFTAYIVRAGGLDGSFSSPNNRIVSRLPGAVQSYNPANNTLTFDLTNVAQTDLPSDHYAIVVTNSVTDAVGNPLNGSFSGVFPSGSNPATATSFVQDLGNVFLQPPSFAGVGLTFATDSGTKGDQNTNNNRPGITGRILSSFPGTVAGVTVYIQFSGIIHPGMASGTLNLGVGQNQRGAIGIVDAAAVTDANGFFSIDYPANLAPLPEGLIRYRLVAVAPTDVAGFQGLAGQMDGSVRIDNSLPFIGSANGQQVSSIPENSQINNLTSLTLQVVDPVNPQGLGSPFAVSSQLSISALDPVSASNTNNYILTQIITNAQGVNTQVDRSNFIASATFTSTTSRIFSSDPYTGFITLTFRTGLPAGRYTLTVRAAGAGAGLQDSAGNSLTDNQSDSSLNVARNYYLDFDIQPTPVYITGYTAYSMDAAGTGTVQSGPRAFYEIPAAGTRRLAPPAAPVEFTVDFSTTLASTGANGNPINYTNLVQLVRSAEQRDQRGRRRLR